VRIVGFNIYIPHHSAAFQHNVNYLSRLDQVLESRLDMSLGTMRSKASRKHSRINRLTRSCHGWKYISSLGIVRNHGGPRESLPVDLVWVTNRRLIFPYRLEPLFFFFCLFFLLLSR
jgi:hypothetical protein